MLTPPQLAALKNELTADPLAIGYATMSDAAAADALNLVRATITVRRKDILPQEVLEAIDSRDFVGTPNPAHVAWFESVTQLRAMRLENDDGTETTTLGNLRRLLSSPTPQGSRARLTGVVTRQGSRAEQLFGTGAAIEHIEVAQARALP